MIEYINNQYQNDTDNIDLNQSGVNTNILIKNKNFNSMFFSSILSSKKKMDLITLRRPRKNYGIKFSNKISN